MTTTRTPATINTGDRRPEGISDVQSREALLTTGALRNAIVDSANFSSIATGAKNVIQIFNVGAERIPGYSTTKAMSMIAPADISDPQEVIAGTTALSVELNTPISLGFEALVSKASRGIKDLQMLCEDPMAQHISVIAINANAMPHNIRKGLEAGFFRYLTKPIEVVEFMDVVDMALDFSGTASDSAIGKGVS